MTPFASQDFGFLDHDRSAADRDVVDTSDSWALVPQTFRARQPLPAPWEERFGPLKAGAVDARVVVGVGAAGADDPQLTVRHVPGPSRARVVVDPRARTPSSARLFARD